MHITDTQSSITKNIYRTNNGILIVNTCGISTSLADEFFILALRGGLRGVMVKAMDFGIVVCEFRLQSRYYVHFQANTLGKGTNPLILLAIG